MLNHAIKKQKKHYKPNKTTNTQCAITTNNLCHFIAGGCSLYIIIQICIVRHILPDMSNDDI